MLTELGQAYSFDVVVRDVDENPDLTDHSWDVPVLLDEAGTPLTRLTAARGALTKAVRRGRGWRRFGLSFTPK